jgi:fibronectin-binding autotransporter adhesin
MISVNIRSILINKAFLIYSLIPLFVLFSQGVNAANVYSGGTGTYNTITWYTNPGRTIVFGAIPGATETINIGNGHIVTIPSGTTVTFAGIIVHDAGASGSLVLGDNVNTAISMTINGNITVNSSGSITVGGNGGATHAIIISGSIVNNNSINLVGAVADVVDITFAGNAIQSLSGTGGTSTFNGFTLNTSLASNLNIAINIRINGNLNFNANGLLVVDANSNITLGPVATVSGFNSNRYVQLDSTTVVNSQLIKVNNNSTASWQIVYPVGTRPGGYTPFDLSVAGGASVTTAPTLNSTLAVKAIYNPSAQGQMRRTFRIVVAGNAAATVFNSADFYYNSGTDVSQGDVLANYSTIWYLNISTGSWATVTGTAPGAGFFTGPGVNSTLGNGTYLYTIGTSTAYPETWYSYQDGNWNDPNVWTLDPSGTTFVNPLTQSPSDGDQVDIRNGNTITIPAGVNNLVQASTTIEGGGELDITTTTGHNLGIVSGSGLFRIKGVSLPIGNYSSFVGASGGTIEYYDTGGNLPAAQTTYYNLLLTNSTGAAITFVTVNNLTVNNNLTINQTSGAGTVTWQINDASNVQRTITINGDISISSNGQIRAGTGNSGSATQHNLTLLGNLTNSGSIKFFDATDAALSEANYASGAVYTAALRGNAVNVTFSGLTNKTATCNNQTDFYRLILNKGTGQQALLIVNSSGAANFRFFGPANLGSNTGVAPNEISNDALALINGTLQLTGTITVPILAVNGGTANDYFSIPQNAGLWVNSSNVSITVTDNSGANDDQRIMLDGLLRVTNGSMFFGRSKGLGSGSAGLFLLEGGTVTTWQFRARVGGSGIFVYNQTGGVFNVGTSGYNSTPVTSGINGGSDARFDLSSTTSSFQMSGGTLNIGTPTAVGGNGINIASSSANYSVTGGTVNVYIPSSGNTFTIGSTVPFYNMNIYREGTVAVLTAQASLSLTILNNLTLITGNTPTLNCNNNNLTVGGNIDIQANTTLTPGTNTITINGGIAQSWTLNGTITSLNNIVVSKSAGVLTLGGSGAFPNIVSLTLTSGTLNDGGKTLTVTTTLNNSATHTGSGAIVHSAAGASTLGGTGGTFGNLSINTNATVTMIGNQTVTGTLRLLSANSTLDIGSNSLAVLGNLYSDGTTGVAFTNTKRIMTHGLRNDNGLSRQATSGVDLLFPVGTSTILYTPATINATATTAGIITVRPVSVAHTNVTTTAQSVRYFWRVTSTGFSGIGSVIHKSYTYSNAVRDAASVNYRPARYDNATYSWAYGPVYDATAGGGLTTIPNFNTGVGWTGSATSLLDGEYTAGNSVAFGAVTVYYSRASGSWGAAGTWSNTAVGGPADAPGAPCSTCPVVIGDGSSNNHSITIDANARSCGS